MTHDILNDGAVMSLSYNTKWYFQLPCSLRWFYCSESIPYLFICDIYFNFLHLWSMLHVKGSFPDRSRSTRVDGFDIE